MRFAVLILLASFAVTCLGCSGGADDPMEQVRQLQEDQKWQESVDLLRKLVDEDPENAEANLLLGVALLRQGDAGAAVWPLRKAAESPEYRSQAGLMFTRALLRGRNTHDAVAAASQVLSEEPDNTIALGLRADAYLGISDYARALDDANRVLELDPENVEMLVPRVMALIGLERIEEAEEALEVAKAKVAGAGPRATEAIRGRVCAARAMFAFEQGDIDEAETRYEECVEQFPKDTLVIQQAVEFYDRTQRPDFGTRLLERAVRDSENPQFRSMLANRMRVLGRPEDEERLLREEAERRPTGTNWYRLADHYVQRDMNDEAVEAFEQVLAVTANPEPMVRFAFADTLIQARQFERARREADGLADEPPLADLLYGRMLLAQGDPEGALEHFGRGIQLWPNNPAARYFAAQAAERVGNFERAISEYRESLRADPTQTEAGLRLSYLYEAMGRLPGALDAVGRYLRANGKDDPQAYVQSIRLAHRLGRRNVLAEGLRRLALIPGQLPLAVAEEAMLAAKERGPAASLVVFERSPLDMGDPANAVAFRVLLEQLGALARHEQAEGFVAVGLTAHPDA
jgi:tetratricopeptide (TPR) repeat protein